MSHSDIRKTLRNKLRLVRFHNTLTFGRDMFRKITYNISLMKQLAARNYEDILQVGALCGKL